MYIYIYYIYCWLKTIVSNKEVIVCIIFLVKYQAMSVYLCLNWGPLFSGKFRKYDDITYNYQLG